MPGEWLREPDSISSAGVVPSSTPTVVLAPHTATTAPAGAGTLPPATPMPTVLPTQVPTQTLSTEHVAERAWHIELFCGTSSSLRYHLVREMHHCMMTSALDNIYFPNKPTTWVLFNCAPQADVKCYNRCSNRLSDPHALNYHRVLICNRDDKHPSQLVLTDDLEKSRSGG